MLRRIVLATVITMITTLSLYSQKGKEGVLMYSIVSKFVEWPASCKSGDFIIGVLGNSPVFSDLKEIAASMTVGDQNIKVKKFNSAAEISNCHVLFVSEANIGEMDAVLTKISNTLIFTNSAGAIKKGSAINFVKVDGKDTFELKAENAKNKGLTVSPVLERMAILVN